jgi:uncharacterized protein (DUF2252 family)
MLAMEELRARAKKLRTSVKRSTLGTKTNLNRDAVGILQRQNATRIPALVPVRMGRMAQSPFAFFRGAAAVMAHDLATTPVTGIEVQACGDAHLSNFGFFASPERQLMFDLNDFDETLPGPWEWDVERLVASLVIAAQANGLSDARAGEVAGAAAAEYRKSMDRLSVVGALSRFHELLTADTIMRGLPRRKRKAIQRHTMKRLQKTIEKARLRTSEQAMSKLSIMDARGVPRIVEQPPLIVRPPRPPRYMQEILRKYRATAQPDVGALLEHFTTVDFTLKVVGVGSVGTRCYIVLGMDVTGKPLFLQIKEATASVLEGYTRRSLLRHHGRRVVAGQQIMQAASDPFLGWTTWKSHHFYVRQFRDMKGSFDVEKLDAFGLVKYARLCGSVLARAHAQAAEPALLAGYLGSSEAFDTAMVAFALAYARQNEADHNALLRAIKSGRVSAEPGV